MSYASRLHFGSRREAQTGLEKGTPLRPKRPNRWWPWERRIWLPPDDDWASLVSRLLCRPVHNSALTRFKLKLTTAKSLLDSDVVPYADFATTGCSLSSSCAS